MKARTRENLALWSLQHRAIRGEPFSFAGHRYLWGIYNDRHPEIVVQKSAQCGASEWFINEAFFIAEKGYVVLFLFPADPQLNDFSHGRVDPAILDSPYLSKRVAGIDNVGLKQIGRGFVYFRGAQIKRKIRSIDADMILFDEYDEMPEEATSLGEKRLGHSLLRYRRYVSTPTIPDSGINHLYEESDQRRWHLKCGHCGEWQFLKFPDNVDMKSAEVICRKCHQPIDRLQEGEWVAEHPDRPVHGYHINKLFCGRTDIRELINNSFKTRSFELQEFFNSDLGEAYVVEGGRLSDDLLMACADDYSMPSTEDRCTMGVDIGKKINVRVSKHRGYIKQAVYIGTVNEFEELDILMRQYDVSMAVVDALPETRKSAEFCSRWPGRAFRCYYWPSDTNRNEYFVHDVEDQKITVNRTMACDYMVDRFRERTNRLPKNIKDVKDYFDHLKAPARIYKKDEKGVEYAFYSEGNKPDHYFHAEVYDEIACNLVREIIEEHEAAHAVEIVTQDDIGLEAVTIGDY